jgi:hypothetical protein
MNEELKTALHKPALVQHSLCGRRILTKKWLDRTTGFGDDDLERNISP